MSDCYRQKTPAGWQCDDDVTGCLYNDGHNGCTHPGESAMPLVEEGTIELLRSHIEEITDTAFVNAIRSLGYTKAVISPETRKVIFSSIIRVKNGCSDKAIISLNEKCAGFHNCIGKKTTCDFCKSRKDR